MHTGNMLAELVVSYRNMNADNMLDKFKRLGFRLRTSREDLGLNQQQLAQISGISRGYISKLESGKASNPSMETIKELAKALNVPLSYLAEGDFTFEESAEDVLPQTSSELLGIFEHLPKNDQLRILDFARRLANSDTPRIIGDQ